VSDEHRDVREWLASDPHKPLWPQPAVFTREDLLRYVDHPFPLTYTPDPPLSRCRRLWLWLTGWLP
jgi:hypothetical protein